jgi:hypothetical protein
VVIVRRGWGDGGIPNIVKKLGRFRNSTDVLGTFHVIASRYGEGLLYSAKCTFMGKYEKYRLLSLSVTPYSLVPDCTGRITE